MSIARFRLPKSNCEWDIQHDEGRDTYTVTARIQVRGTQVGQSAAITGAALATSYGDYFIDTLVSDLERAVGRVVVRG